MELNWIIIIIITIIIIIIIILIIIIVAFVLCACCSHGQRPISLLRHQRLIFPSIRSKCLQF